MYFSMDQIQHPPLQRTPVKQNKTKIKQSILNRVPVVAQTQGFDTGNNISTVSMYYIKFTSKKRKENLEPELERD